MPKPTPRSPTISINNLADIALVFIAFGSIRTVDSKVICSNVASAQPGLCGIPLPAPDFASGLPPKRKLVARPTGSYHHLASKTRRRTIMAHLYLQPARSIVASGSDL